MDYHSFLPMDEKHLRQFGENTARAMRPRGLMGGGQVRRETLAELREIQSVRDRLAAEGVRQEGAAVWLLDNWYLAQRECTGGAGAFRRARRLRYVPREGRRPLIMELARSYVRAAGPEAGRERLAVFLEGFQSVLPLTETELSLLVPALKCALAERLARLSRELIHGEGKDGAALERGMEAAFTALRVLTGSDMAPLLEEASRVDQTLRRDPAGRYEEMSDETRARYRAQVCRMARKSGISELDMAERVVARARDSEGEDRHVGRQLFPVGNTRPAESLYMGGIVLCTLFVALLLGFWLDRAWLAILLWLPVSDIVKNCADFLAVRLVRPRHVHRLELKNGIPQEARTLCVIACLLTGEGSGAALAEQLEQYRLANRDSGRELKFGLLADLGDRETPMGEREEHWVAAAQAAMERLNAKYGGGFYLLFRRPIFHRPDERYMGWERKRGALIELTRLLRERRNGLSVLAGDRDALKGIKYVITLDSDTCLNVGTARELVGAMLHPLNRPVVDGKRRVVSEGYGLLQPRVAVDLESANRSQFSRIFAGQGGVDPYSSAASDVYHDLFDQGTYTGKGIFDVDVFLDCLDRRLPQNAVLSHDLLEGSYLRAGLIGDVELTDGYPYQITSYFSRLHRWVRGDWQLLPWLFGRVRDERGRRVECPLTPMARFKIFDNLRRSLSPVLSMLALLLGMCLDGPIFTVAAGVAVLSAASHLLLSGADLAARRGRGLAERYHATIIAGFSGVILQTLVQLLLLPQQAWVCGSAAVTALWRMGVTHRGMLAWTTAAEAERKAKDSLRADYRTLWPIAAVGLFGVVCARFPLGAAAGLVWLATPLFAWCMSRPIQPGRTVPEGDRAFLLHQAALIWGYFADFLRPQDHYLPPDNYQEQPAVGLARRTSPTNIGMALLCCLTAADLKIIPRNRAIELVGHMVDTLEALPKWKGHLYNWYDTATAEPMEPRYVSSVDSGNLCGCLIALGEGMRAWGETELAVRVEALAEAMDLAALYDEERKLFFIGYDCQKEAYTEGWYDLMASEARQLSYIAVARGEVSPRHWRRLSRALVGQDHYRGMASWTGTMFEYFMPHLLLPTYENSLLYESLTFCVYAQKKRVKGTDAPWGISESGFYAFDGAMNYQYKAHGVQRLGLKRGLDRELVVAPYATFLALPLVPRSGGRNLRRLQALGLEGTYGLYEAVDYSRGKPFAPVRSYMAHHLGMSLVAIGNALEDGVMQKRFMCNADMTAYRELLQEKVPVGAQIMRTPEKEVPEKPDRPSAAEFSRAGTGYDRGRPACHLLTGGAWRVLCTDTGAIRSRMGKTELTRCQWDRPGAPTGVSFFLNTQEGLFPLTPAPLYREGPEYQWRFQSGGASWHGAWKDYASNLTLQVSQWENGEVWEASLGWSGQGSREAELVCYLEPVLAKPEDYLVHPAFSKLSLETEALGNGVLFTRRPKRQGENRPALAVLWSGTEVTFDTSRETALGRGALMALEQALSRPATGSVGGVLDPCLLARFPVTLREGQERKLRVVLSAADSGEQAIAAGERLLVLPKTQVVTPLEQLSHQLYLTRGETLQIFELLKRLQFPGKSWVKRGSAEQAALWPYGISGDLPILTHGVEGEEQLEGAVFLCKAHQVLTRLGFPFDLVLFLSEGGDYRQPLRSAIRDGLALQNWGHQLGVHGGVFLLEDAPAVRAAALWYQGEEGMEPLAYLPRPMVPLELGTPSFHFEPDGSFVFETGKRLPPVGWSMMLSNPDFGWMTDETGGGHLWYKNAKENPLTEWRNDSLAIGGPECWCFCQNGEERSFFSGGDGLECRVSYRPGLARWEKKWGGLTMTCRAFVPPEEPARYLLLEVSGGVGEVVGRLEGRELGRWRLEGRLCLRTQPDQQGRAPVTAPFPEVDRAAALEQETLAYWRQRVSRLTVQTPDPELNHYLNGWDLYQVLACRLFGRTSLYQNGGAYGFRDQLQDVCAVITTAPELVRAQLLRACAHQYREGDVQHWWHPTADGSQEKGVRTRISDDLLWLPYTLCAYVEQTGLRDILAEQAPFLSSPPLRAGERERFEAAAIEGSASVLDHARLAIQCVLDRGFGPHGLVKMGTGDWNDGMDLVGAGGAGESVWLTWFLALVLEQFDRLTGESAYQETIRACTQAANAAWDGGWFLRGYYDNGATLGSHKDEACQIDSIAQSFAALCKGADKEKARQGVRAALDRLRDRDHGLVKLFAPPFDAGAQDPGYIQGYLPGVRENGGQYTHAAVWLAQACFRLDLIEDGAELLHALLPATHPPEIYRAEPYVLAADVYANPQHPGRGGWSWYTGAAGWYYRVAVEELLGLKVRGGLLYLSPKLPKDWAGYTAEWNRLRIEVRRGGAGGLTVDGKPHQGGIPLTGCHRVLFLF